MGVWDLGLEDLGFRAWAGRILGLGFRLGGFRLLSRTVDMSYTLVALAPLKRHGLCKDAFIHLSVFFRARKEALRGRMGAFAALRRESSPWFLIGNGGMDPDDSP